MSAMQISVFSHECGGNMPVSIVLPTFEKNASKLDRSSCKTLWLLHGGGGDHTSFLCRSKIALYAIEHSIAVVMPFVGRCHYANIPDLGNFFDYLSDELPSLLRSTFPLSPEREDNFVCGASAGALGAAKLAFTFPERFAAVGLFSVPPLRPALFETKHHEELPLSRRLKRIFGDDLSACDGGPDDIESLIESYARYSAESFPLKVFTACGDIDPGLQTHLACLDQLKANGVPYHSETIRGAHEWRVWDKALEDYVEWMLR